jgi:CheY-like chemotaxis protein/DNA-binding transcriptional ArsR family regulator
MNTPPSSENPVRVLVLDDEEPAVQELVFALEAAGVSAVGATSPSEALETFMRDVDIGVIVSDIRMPMQDGIEFLRNIRKCGARGKACEVILATGFPEFETAVQALELRVARYLIKPLEVEEVLVSVSQAMTEYSESILAGKIHNLMVEGLGRILATQSNLRHDQEVSPETPKLAPTEAAGSRRIKTLKAMLALRDIRSKFLPAELFSDPTWFMLLDLALLEREGRKVSVSALCMAAGVSQTTALRRVQELVEMKILRRIEDPQDGRRSYVELAEDARSRLDAMLDHISSTRTGGP